MDAGKIAEITAKVTKAREDMKVTRAADAAEFMGKWELAVLLSMVGLSNEQKSRVETITHTAFLAGHEYGEVATTVELSRLI